MNKQELKSLLENIYEAMILPTLGDQYLNNPGLLNPPPVEVPDDLFDSDVPPPPDITLGPGLHWEWDAGRGGWTIQRDPEWWENLPPDIRKPEPTWGEWLQNPTIRDVPRMPWAPPYPYQG